MKKKIEKMLEEAKFYANVKTENETQYKWEGIVLGLERALEVLNS